MTSKVPIQVGTFFILISVVLPLVGLNRVDKSIGFICLLH